MRAFLGDGSARQRREEIRLGKRPIDSTLGERVCFCVSLVTYCWIVFHFLKLMLFLTGLPFRQLRLRVPLAVPFVDPPAAASGIFLITNLLCVTD